MRSIADHVLDIAQNSVAANAKHVWIRFFENRDEIFFTIKDDGEGMDKAIFANVFDPFFTTKHKKKKFGLGLPFLKQNAELTGGYVKLSSEKGKGTTVEVKFVKNIDCPPIGDLGGTFATLVTSSMNVEWYVKRCLEEKCYEFSTEVLEGVDLTLSPVIKGVFEYFTESEKEIQEKSGGVDGAHHTRNGSEV